MKRFIIPAMFSIVAITGCSDSVPKCSDKETTDLVAQIANREMVNQLGAEIAKFFSYTVVDIRTISENEKTGAYECAAKLGVTAKNTGQTNEVKITYIVERSDKGDEFYVNVFGL